MSSRSTYLKDRRPYQGNDDDPNTEVLHPWHSTYERRMRVVYGTGDGDAVYVG